MLKLVLLLALFGQTTYEPGSYQEAAVTTGTTVLRTEFGNPAILDGSLEVDPGDWSASAHGDAGGVVYEIEWTHEVPAGGLGVLEVYVDEAQIDYKTTVALVAANPGTFCCFDDSSIPPKANLGNNNPATVYYHPAGSTDPSSDGKVVRIGSKRHVIQLGNNAIVRGIEARRSVGNDGEIVLGDNGLIDRCLIDGNYKHGALLASGEVWNSIVLPGFRTTYPGAEASNSYLVFFKADPTGLRTHIGRTIILGGWTPEHMADGRQWGDAVVQHGGGAEIYQQASIDGLIVAHCNFTGLASATNVLIDGVYLHDCATKLPTWAATGTSQANRVLSRSLPDVDIAIATYDGSFDFQDPCIYINASDGAGDIARITGADSYLRIQNGFIYNDPVASPSNSHRAISSLGSDAGRVVELNNSLITEVSFWAFAGPGTGLTYTGSRNIFIRYDGADATLPPGMSAQTNLVVSTATMTNGQILALLDAFFTGDPADGDFRNSQAALLAINGGVFPDGQPISNYVIGPRTHWDYAANRPADGPPQAWPYVPLTIADCRKWLRGGLPNTTRDKNGRYIRLSNGELLR